LTLNDFGVIILKQQQAGYKMELAQATASIWQIAEQNGVGFLEQLMEMADNLQDYNRSNRIAYRLVMQAGNEMFAPA
jgi:hypothetical protein